MGKKIYKNAKKAEKDAIAFLNEKGYEIIEVQKQETFLIYIDDKPFKTHVQADFIAKKRGKKYVIEVKTGQKTRATTAVVRRQLLEYFLVFNPAGVLLLDMDRRTLKKIEFDWFRPLYFSKKVIVTGILGLIAGILIWYFSAS